MTPKFVPIATPQELSKMEERKHKNSNTFVKNATKGFLDFYTYQAYRSGIDNDIIALTKEGTGIRSIARLLKISPTTLLARIIAIAKKIVQPSIPEEKFIKQMK